MSRELSDLFRVPVNHDLASRFGEYLASDVYLQSYAKTEHWKKREERNRSAFRVEGNDICVDIFVKPGLSDFYPNCFPTLKTKYMFDGTVRRGYESSDYQGRAGSVRFFINEFRKFLLHQQRCYCGLGYDPLYHFNRNWPAGSGMISADDIITEYGKNRDHAIVKASHIFNVLFEKAESHLGRMKRVLEIGAGTGIFCRIIKKYYPNVKIVVVDLPESIPYTITSLLYANPDATYLLPHEITSDLDIYTYDFVFLSPVQVKVIQHHTIDFAINTMSFQEMAKPDIREYFELLRNVLKDDNLFYCLNAVEKPMVVDHNEVPIRFFEYPWVEDDEDVSYSLSPVHHHMTTKPFYERITKLAVNS
jgi:SAM-dependent methyltransferase